MGCFTVVRTMHTIRPCLIEHKNKEVVGVGTALTGRPRERVITATTAETNLLGLDGALSRRLTSSGVLIGSMDLKLVHASR